MLELAEFHGENKEIGLEAAKKFLLDVWEGYKKAFDELRYRMTTSKDKPLSSLPPTVDAFIHHTPRPKFQTKIWNTYHIAKPKTLHPIEYDSFQYDTDLQ